MFRTSLGQPQSSNAILVENSAEWREALVPFLEQTGMRVSACSCVGEALGILEEWPGFDFAFIELDLPDRPGWQLWNKHLSRIVRPASVLHRSATRTYSLAEPAAHQP